MNMKKLFSILFFLVFLVTVKAQQQISIFFDSNRHEINVVELKRLTDWMKANKDSKIVAINGYTDEDGTNGFNDTLAKKRVNFIYNKIKGVIAIRDDFKTRSFGENFQQSKTKAENRKVTIYYILAKDLERENEILGIKPAVVEPVVVEPAEIVPIEEETMNFPEGATLEEKIGLSKKGTLIRLNDINFYLNSFALMPTSKPAIDELVYVMRKFPKLKIELQGHICCVNKDVKNLSTDRAKQVKRILVSEGIDSNRVTVKGFGVSKPKHPIPEQNETEAARNRRVEIMVLDK